jgi:hypothetical protein
MSDLGGANSSHRSNAKKEKSSDESSEKTEKTEGEKGPSPKSKSDTRNDVAQKKQQRQTIDISSVMASRSSSAPKFFSNPSSSNEGEGLEKTTPPTLRDKPIGRETEQGPINGKNTTSMSVLAEASGGESPTGSTTPSNSARDINKSKVRDMFARKKSNAHLIPPTTMTTTKEMEKTESLTGSVIHKRHPGLATISPSASLDGGDFNRFQEALETFKVPVGQSTLFGINKDKQEVEGLSETQVEMHIGFSALCISDHRACVARWILLKEVQALSSKLDSFCPGEGTVDTIFEEYKKMAEDYRETMAKIYRDSLEESKAKVEVLTVELKESRKKEENLERKLKKKRKKCRDLEASLQKYLSETQSASAESLSYAQGPNGDNRQAGGYQRTEELALKRFNEMKRKERMLQQSRYLTNVAAELLEDERKTEIADQKNSRLEGVTEETSTS